MTSTSGSEDEGVERAEEQGGYGSPTPEQEAGGLTGQKSQDSQGSQGSQAPGPSEDDDEDQGEHDVD
ncbi:hypothetical protein [Sinomonas susongensis]|uniref:hypothetical protein n=1 Tax=Sinomonas susongensis TaxID=1324851 RepID=UPI001107C1E9|nr:hypothetical protein [Sinomonas susongensis]